MVLCWDEYKNSFFTPRIEFAKIIPTIVMNEAFIAKGTEVGNIWLLPFEQLLRDFLKD